MINFFRKIRRKLADDNQLLKYSRYAIGEILLVMIGILLALQVNNWNEQRKLLLNEQELYKKLVLDLTNEELAMTRWSRWSETHQDLHYIIYNKTKGKFKGDSAISYNMLQYTFTYRPKIKDIYEETINKISNENIRDLMRDYIIRENALRLAIEDYNYYKIKSTRPFLEKHDLFNLDEAFKDESYDNSRSRSLELINSDKLEEHFNSGEFNSIIVQLRLHTSWVIQNFQIMKEFNQRLKLELENEIRKE